MPIFRYTCKKCGNHFELLLPRWDSPAQCPGCKSDELEKELNRFAAVTAKATGCPALPACPSGGSCGCAGSCPHKH